MWTYLYNSKTAVSFIILLALNGICASSMVVPDLPSANNASYCLSGLTIDQINSTICTQYTCVGNVNNCSYFQSINGLYLFWNHQYQSWIINSNLEDNGYVVHCNKTLLDDCISNATWMYYDGTSEYLHPKLGIEACDYSVKQCKHHHSYCIYNTDLDDLEINTELGGQYLFEGCHMGEPYFVYSSLDFRANIAPTTYTNNFILHWNAIFEVWMINNNMTAARFAFCDRKKISKCNRKWEIYNGIYNGDTCDKENASFKKKDGYHRKKNIYNGDTYIKDSNVYFGSCDSLACYPM